MNFKANQSFLSEKEELKEDPRDPKKDDAVNEEEGEDEEEEEEDDKGLVNEGKELVSKSRDNLNAACANFLVNLQSTLGMVMLMNLKIEDKNDQVPLGVGLLTAAFGYLMSFLLSGEQPFFKGLSLTQALILEYQLRRYGYNSIFLTSMTTGLLIVIFTVVGISKLIKSTPMCVVIGLQIGIGKLAW